MEAEGGMKPSLLPSGFFVSRVFFWGRRSLSFKLVFFSPRFFFWVGVPLQAQAAKSRVPLFVPWPLGI